MYVCRIKGEVTGWNNPNIPIHYLYPSPDINKTINPRKGHVTRTGQTKNSFKDFVEEPERNRLF
jgi:hypothetical protein